MTRGPQRKVREGTAMFVFLVGARLRLVSVVPVSVLVTGAMTCVKEGQTRKRKSEPHPETATAKQTSKAVSRATR